MPEKSTRSNARLIVAVGLSAGLIPLNSTSIAIALPMIGAHFNADNSLLSQWVLASYLLASVLFLGPAGKMGDIWGLFRLLRLGRILFLVGALIGALAPNVALLVLSRIIMGLGSAFLMPSAIAIVRNAVGAEQRASALGALAGGLAIAAALGPPVGGLLVHQFGWQSVFWLNPPLLLLSALLSRGFHLPLVESGGQRREFDFTGSFLLISLLACFVVGIRLPGLKGQLLLATCLLLTAAFIRWELRLKEPVVDVRLFRNRVFSCAILIIAAQNFGMYGVLFQMPYMLVELYDMAPSKIGLMMLVTTAGMAVFSPLGGRLTRYFSKQRITLVGSCCALAGLLGLANQSSWNALLSLIPWLALVGGGLGLNTAPVQATVLGSVAEKDAGMASGALSIFRYLGSIVGVALLGLLLAQTGIDSIERFQSGFYLYATGYLACVLLALGMKLPAARRPC
ncbi:MAG: MFS transporter [Gammaproteobacteria bacterium]